MQKGNLIRKLIVFIVLFTSVNAWSQAPASFTYYPTNASATFYGQVHLNGVPASSGDWIAAFDPNGNCAGASEIVLFNGDAYINLVIYGDDATTPNLDEGITGAEDFYLKIYDSFYGIIHDYQSPTNIVSFSGWTNTNGAPLPNYNNTNTIYNFLFTPPIIDGCTDSLASNYNPLANNDDGSCCYSINSSSSTDTQVACDSYDWNGTTFTTSGVYSYSTTNAIGCDSTTTLYLTINNSTTSSETRTECDNYDWNGTTFTTSGVYSYSTTNVGGCDSTATLDLTINNSTTSTETRTECDSFLWNGTSYTTSGVYTYSNTNAIGCDSTATLDLTINNSTTSSETRVECDSYLWNGTTFTTSGVYSYSTTNVGGCDSTATLDLTINNSTTSTETRVECDNYDWNGTTYTTSGLYSYSTTNVGGCDSTATLDLTINNSSSSYNSITAYDSYMWNGLNYTLSGLYTFQTATINGCDSIASLSLTILDSSLVGLGAAPTSFNYIPTNLSGVMYGQVQLNGMPSEFGDWVAAFDSAGNCAGASPLVINNGLAYINLVIYSDDTLSTTIDEGITNFEDFYLKVYDLSQNAILDYESFTNIVSLSGWSNQNGAPMPNFDNPNQIYNFLYTPVTFSVSDTLLCISDSPISISNAFPLGGVYSGQGLVNNTFDPSLVGVGTYPITYTYNGISSIVNIHVYSPTTESSTVYSCDSYLWNNQNLTTTGTYIDTLSNLGGCDSIIILNLTIADSTVSFDTISSCYSFSWNGVTYTQSGNFTFFTTNTNGCDSLAMLNLTINDSTTSQETRTECDSYLWNGNSYLVSGVYTYLTTNSNGCDSTATLNLFIENSTTSTTYVTECNYYTWNGTTYTNSGVYTYSTTNSVGCDSTATLNLTITNSTTSVTSIVECDSYTWNGTIYDTSGVYTYSTTNAVGCDSVATLDLVIYNSEASYTEATACDNYSWLNYTFAASGNYYIQDTTANGCLINDTLILTIINSTSSTTNITECDSFTWNGTLYTSSGVYTYSTTNSVGCDSTATLNLTITNSTTSVTSIVECDSYTWNGTTYTTSDTYTYSTLNTNGCDSTANLNLTINYSTSTNMPFTSCYSYLWNGINLDSTGTYIYIGNNQYGCTHIDTLDLTISGVDAMSYVTTCEEFLWNGNIYDSSGIYIYNNGICTDTLTLEIVDASSSYESRVECNSYNWNGVTYVSSGIYSYSTLNSNGCDSTATLNLIINYSNSSIENTTVCDSYLWNGNVYSLSGTYTFFTQTVLGCDSVATLNLIILNSSTSTSYATNCNSYMWNGNNYTSTGVYTYSATNSVGCDSTATLNLTINNSSNSYDTVSVCSSYLWNNQVLTSSGNYIDSSLNAYSCLHVSYLSLVVEVCGCTDSTMFNYNINATMDDSTCTPFVYGCMDSLAINYNFMANVNDTLICIYIFYGCTDSLAINYNSIANIDDSSCVLCSYMDNDYIEDVTPTNVTCNGGNDASIYGIYLGNQILYNGNGPYMYSVDSGFTFQSSSTFNDLSAGNYYVTYMDSIGCINPNTGLFWMQITEPDAFVYNAIENDVSCSGGDDGGINLNVVSGNTSPYSISWSNGTTGNNTTNLTNGIYQAYVSDANGCQDTLTYFILHPLPIVSAINTTDVSCVGGTDGSASINSSGGTPPFTYLWSDGQSGNTATNLSEGSYQVFVTDSANCLDTAYFSINSNPINISISTTNVSCNGNDGTIDATISGGEAPYSFTWYYDVPGFGFIPAFFQEDISNIPSGTYFVVVTDAYACSVNSDTITLIVDDVLINATTTDVSCNGGNDGAIDVTASGGLSPYTYLWSDGSNTEDLINITAANYTITVTDANNCSSSDSIIISEPNQITVSANITNVSTNCDGAIDVSVSGGTPPYSFAWQIPTTSITDSFSVTSAPATSSHPYFSYGPFQVYEIDGVQGAELTLIRGETYYFTMDNVPFFHPFHISTDMFGGQMGSFIGQVTAGVTNLDAPGTFSATTYQTLAFTPDSSHTDTLYYQCGNHMYMGYRLIIIDEITSEDLTDLCEGNYDLIVTDANGCDTTNTYFVSDIVYGCIDSTMFNYNPLATVDDSSCTPFIYGCTDPTATNYDPLATIDDGSCTIVSTCANPSPSGAYVSELIHDRARINWDNMNDANCMVNQYRIRYRVQGTSSWSSKTMSGSGLCVFGLNTTSKKILGLTPSTTYEYYMKAWYCGGSNSGWSALQQFTTADECPNVINFAASTPTTTKATFTWDTTAAYSFVRIKLRLDTLGSAWATAGGFGVFYPALTKNKNGLTPGQPYRASARTWCDPTGGTYRAAGWTSPIFWTQPTVIRVDGGSAINNLVIYPNPSRDVFNISFTSEEEQNLRVRILNVIGEELVNENLEQFVGEYTKQIDLTGNAKGIYFLEIETDNGVINKKLILQ